MPAQTDRNATMRRILERHSLFSSLTDSGLDQLLVHARVDVYRARQTIFEKGSPGLGFLAIIKGKVKISSLGPEGDQIVLNLINEGDVFGEIALLDGKDRTADAIAMTDCELLAIDRRDFVPFVRANPEVALRLLSVMCARLRHSTEQIEDMIFLDAPSRMAKKLLELAETVAEPQGPDAAPMVAISQSETRQHGRADARKHQQAPLGVAAGGHPPGRTRHDHHSRCRSLAPAIRVSSAKCDPLHNEQESGRFWSGCDPFHIKRFATRVAFPNTRPTRRRGK